MSFGEMFSTIRNDKFVPVQRVEDERPVRRLPAVGEAEQEVP